MPANLAPHRAVDPGTGLPVGRRVLWAVPFLALPFLLSSLSARADDPRPLLLELQARSDFTAALSTVEAELAEDTARARRLGLDYLRARLLLRLDRKAEAREVLVAILGGDTALGPHSRYLLAQEQERAGNHEVAAGLVASLLGASPPKELVAPGVRLLQRTLLRGGDCRLLRGLTGQRWRQNDQRMLALARAECLLRDGDADGARQALLALLEEERGDVVARSVAERLAGLRDGLDARGHFLLGFALYSHREFDPAIYHLERALELLPASQSVSRREVFECRYAIARGHFWQGRHQQAAAAFGTLAASTQDSTRRAQTLYQQGRSYELAGSWDRALVVFRGAYETQPAGRFADAALISYLRLQYLQGREEQALSALDALASGRFFSTLSRANLFLASSDLVLGRSDRAEAWLARVAQLGRVPDAEVGYWQGRLRELQGQPKAATQHYLSVIRGAPYHPFAVAARQRLTSPDLLPVARRRGLELARGSRNEELYDAWLLLGPQHPLGLPLRQRLRQQLAKSSSHATFLGLEALPTVRWPLWQHGAAQPQELLLSLGLFDEAAGAVLRHFPPSDPNLAFTGSLALARAGANYRSLYLAEVLSRRVPRRLPEDLLPVAFRRLVFPFAFGDLILREASRQQVDPFLVAGVIREESRFNPRAFSAAAARGLTQFVFTTARRLAPTIGIPDLQPADLEQPPVAIALGAAYLAELSQTVGGGEVRMVAAYNAGEPQARLWGRYCVSDEPEEYLTKIAFRETRNYATKVLRSRAHYTELYGTELEQPAVVAGDARPD